MKVYANKKELHRFGCNSLIMSDLMKQLIPETNGTISLSIGKPFQTFIYIRLCLC